VVPPTPVPTRTGCRFRFPQWNRSLKKLTGCAEMPGSRASETKMEPIKIVHQLSIQSEDKRGGNR